MWLKINSVKSAVWKTVGVIMLITMYRVLSENVPIWIGVDIPYIKVWLMNDWQPLNAMDTLFYTLMALLLIVAWIDGAVVTLIRIIFGFVIYFWVFMPFGTIGAQISIEETYFCFQLGILPLFLLYITANAVILFVEIWKGYEAFKNPCFYPVAIEDMEKTEKIQTNLIKAYGQWNEKKTDTA